MEVRFRRHYSRSIVAARHFTECRAAPIPDPETTLIVCRCRCATDREIRRAVREGASSVRAIATRCGAGMGCGGCVDAVQEILASELGATARAVETIRSSALS